MMTMTTKTEATVRPATTATPTLPFSPRIPVDESVIKFSQIDDKWMVLQTSVGEAKDGLKYLRGNSRRIVVKTGDDIARPCFSENGWAWLASIHIREDYEAGSGCDSATACLAAIRPRRPLGNSAVDGRLWTDNVVAIDGLLQSWATLASMCCTLCNEALTASESPAARLTAVRPFGPI
jgi:hypothetical protein